MSLLVLVARIGGRRVAIRADAVRAVVEIGEVAPVPRAPPHVAGIAALRSRVLTVIDTYRSIGLDAPGDGRRDAVFVELDGHGYALAVDSVDDVVDAGGGILPMPAPPRGGWARVAAGAVETDGGLLMLLDIGSLVAGPADTAVREGSSAFSNPARPAETADAA